MVAHAAIPQETTATILGRQAALAREQRRLVVAVVGGAHLSGAVAQLLQLDLRCLLREVVLLLHLFHGLAHDSP